MDITEEILERLAAMPACSPHLGTAVAAAVVYSVSSADANTMVEMSLETASDDTLGSSLDYWRDQCVVPACEAAVSNGSYSASRAMLSSGGSSQDLSPPTACLAPATMSSTAFGASLMASPVCSGCAPSDPNAAPSTDDGDGDSFPIAIVIGVCVAVVLIGIIIAAIIVVRKKRSKNKVSDFGLVGDQNIMDGNNFEMYMPQLNIASEDLDMEELHDVDNATATGHPSTTPHHQPQQPQPAAATAPRKSTGGNHGSIFDFI